MAHHYLITGGLGLIGSTLANATHGPTTIISRSDAHKDRITRSEVTIHYTSLLDMTANDLKGIDTIYHLASTVDNYNVLTDPYIDMNTNIRGTIHLLELCKELPKKPKFVFSSTFFVYGNQYEKQHKPITEESPTDPLALYPATKLCAEHVIKLYGKLYSIPYLICRFTNVYGEHESFANKKKGALNYLIMQAIRGETLPIYKGGNFYRDYVHVSDVVEALLFLDRKNSINDTYLIGYGEPVLFKKMIDYLINITGSLSSIQQIDPPDFHRIVGINNFVADISKIKSLGWTPAVDYKTGIQRIVDYYKTLSPHTSNVTVSG